ERDAVGDQRIGPELNLVGLDFTTVAVDVDDARDFLKARCDLPVEYGAQVHQRSLRVDNLKLENLTECRRHRDHLGRAVTGWEHRSALREPFHHEPAHEIDIEPVVKVD